MTETERIDAFILYALNKFNALKQNKYLKLKNANT